MTRPHFPHIIKLRNYIQIPQFSLSSTLLERKMRPRPRLWFWPTQRPCFRVSSSCTLYEVFGNFAWRNAPPRKRVTQSEKALALRDREVLPRKRRRGARLWGNGDRGTCLTEGEDLLRRSAGLMLAKNSKFFWGGVGESY